MGAMPVVEAAGRPAGPGSPCPGQAQVGALAGGSASRVLHGSPGAAPWFPSKRTPRAGRSRANSP
eukprot:3645545-Lingulodinium_polyedra.AAC.1